MEWNAKRYFEAKRVAASLPEDINLAQLLLVAGSPEGQRAIVDEISSRNRRREGNRAADMKESHLTFNEYAAHDETAHPCRCWISGRENWGHNSTDVLHPDEFLDGVQARYEYENDC